MADSQRRTSGDFAKKVQRQLSRGKEKVTMLQNPLFFLVSVTLHTLSLPLLPLQVLQKLGKTVETRDNQFEDRLQQFIDQQVNKSMMGK